MVAANYLKLCPKDKRLAAVLEKVDELIEAEREDEEYEERSTVSCNKIRGQIRRFLQKEAITQTAFLKYLNVNSNSYGRFMKLKGAWNGGQNGTYWAAYRFFKHQKTAEKAIPKPKKKASGKQTTLTKDGKMAPGGGSAKKKKRGQPTADPVLLATLAKIESMPSVIEDENAQILMNCNDVRKAINKFLTDTDVSQTRFGKIIGVAPNSMTRFLGESGPDGGATNGTYFKAYDFFEKKRIVEGTAKSKKRLRVEANAKEHPEGYTKRQRLTNGRMRGRMWIMAGDPVFEAMQFEQFRKGQKKAWGEGE